MGFNSGFKGLSLKFRQNKSYHQKQTTRWDTVTSLSLNPLNQLSTDVTSFRLSKSHYSPPVLFKSANNFGSVFFFFEIVWIAEFARPNSRHKSVSCFFFFPFFYSLIALTIYIRSSELFVGDCSHVITLSPVNCRSRKVEGNFTHKVIYRHYCHFQTWKLRERFRRITYSRKRTWSNSQI